MFENIQIKASLSVIPLHQDHKLKDTPKAKKTC